MLDGCNRRFKVAGGLGASFLTSMVSFKGDLFSGFAMNLITDVTLARLKSMVPTVLPEAVADNWSFKVVQGTEASREMPEMLTHLANIVDVFALEIAISPTKSLLFSTSPSIREAFRTLRYKKQAWPFS